MMWRKTGVSNSEILAAKTPVPKMAEFGLPSDFSMKAYSDKTLDLEQRRRFITRITMLFSFLIIFAVLLAYKIAFLMFSPVFFVIAYYLLKKPLNLLIASGVKSDDWELNLKDEAEDYSAAVAEWRFRQTEFGEGYWRGLKGIAFEKAVAEFFRRRGCTASLTGMTGDGGIDILLNIGEKRYWCQCKGHAAPVPVGEIRRIAGATLKSQGMAYPVMFATNGYTKPAILEAVELGVLCFDTVDLVKRAPLSLILEL